MKEFKSFLWGIAFIAVGIILGLNALDITNINIFFEGWWTLFIIIPCFIGLFGDDSKTGNIIGLLLGVSLLLSCRDILDVNLIWKLALPVVLIIIGISCLFKNTINTKINKEIKKLNKNMNKDNEYCSTFSEQNVNFDNQEFKGADLTAVFGSVNLDLRKAKIKEDQVINCSAIFGGIDIVVPEGVTVKVKSNALFGGVSNKVTNKEGDKVIYINAMCMFGGIDIK